MPNNEQVLLVLCNTFSGIAVFRCHGVVERCVALVVVFFFRLIWNDEKTKTSTSDVGWRLDFEVLLFGSYHHFSNLHNLVNVSTNEKKKEPQRNTRSRIRFRETRRNSDPIIETLNFVFDDTQLFSAEVTVFLPSLSLPTTNSS